MTKFIIKADAVFEAENLDDAFFKLSQHFKYLETLEGEDPQLIARGVVSIEKENGD